MAMRVHILALLGDDSYAFERRFRVAGHTLGPWLVALRSVWDTSQRDMDWQAALLSRALGAVAFRATTVDDAFLDLALFRDGELAYRFEHRFGGLADAQLEEAIEDATYDDEADSEADDGPRRQAAPDLTRPVSPETAMAMADDLFDPAPCKLMADGISPIEAARTIAEERARAIAEACRAGGAEVDVEPLRRVLRGEIRQRNDEELSAWADVPELIATMGVRGFRAWLLEENRAEKQAEAEVIAAGSSDFERAPTQSRTQVAPKRRWLDYLFRAAVLTAGGALGYVLTHSWVWAFVGAITLAFVVPMLLVIGRLSLMARRGRRAMEAFEQTMEADAELSLEQRLAFEPLLRDWGDLAIRLGGESPPGGLVGALYPHAAGPAAAEGLRARIASGEDLSSLEAEIGGLRRALIDAELAGDDLEPLKQRWRDISPETTGGD